jgi:HlyD family secretion protein
MTAIAVVPLACRDSKEVQAADPPKIEVKAAVAPFDGIAVTTPIEGQIAELRVAEGAAVNAGDVIATLTNPAVERDLAYARAAVLSSEHRLRSISGSRPAPPRTNRERERAVAEVVKQKQQRLERLRGLLASGDVARQDVENAEAELAVARRELDAAREVPPAAAPSNDTAVLQAEVERARAEQAFAEHRKSQLVITAPASGTIAKLRIAKGTQVWMRDPVAEIVDSTMARVEAAVAPELVRFVSVGRPVDIKLMTIPPRRYREPIARIVPPGGAGGSAIIVHVPNPDRMLQPGTPAVITIQ